MNKNETMTCNKKKHIKIASTIFFIWNFNYTIKKSLNGSNFDYIASFSVYNNQATGPGSGPEPKLKRDRDWDQLLGSEMTRTWPRPCLVCVLALSCLLSVDVGFVLPKSSILIGLVVLAGVDSLTHQLSSLGEYTHSRKIEIQTTVDTILRLVKRYQGTWLDRHW